MHQPYALRRKLRAGDERVPRPRPPRQAAEKRHGARDLRAAPAAGALGPQQRPVLPQAAGAAPAAAAYAGDLLAFAADFAAATPGGGAAVKKKAPPKKKVKVPQVQ